MTAEKGWGLKGIHTELMFRRTDHVAFRQLMGEGGAVLLNLRSGAYHRINSTGVIIWNLIESPASVAEITAGLADVVSLPEEEIAGDTKEFLQELADRGLIEPQ